MLLSILLSIVAFVVALVERTCDETFSTWLLIYALLPGFALFLTCVVLCKLALCTEKIIKENEEVKEVVMGCGCLSILACYLTFTYVWLIYGLVIFFPAMSTHPCRVLVIVSTTWRFLHLHFICT